MYCVDLPKTPGEEWVKVKEYAKASRGTGKTGREGWLEYVGVLGKEEAMAQRALAKTNPPRVPLSAVN